MKEPPSSSPLKIPEIALIIISHLNPTSILSIRLVSRQINTLIENHQKSISKCCISSYFPKTVDWHPPELDNPPKNFHLRILTRLPKAWAIARRANKNYECHVETEFPLEENGTPAGAPILVVLEPTPYYGAFLARCARAILTIWTINDIRQQASPFPPPPRYISSIPPPPSSRWRRTKLRRLFSRLSSLFTTSHPRPCPTPSIHPNTHAYLSTIPPRPTPQPASSLAIQRKFLHSLPHSYLVDLGWVIDYLNLGLIYHYVDTFIFALQQAPPFLLSWSSRNPLEKKWARDLASGVVQQRLHLHHSSPFPQDVLDAMYTVVPWFPEEHEALVEEASRVKAELTNGDWRNGGRSERKPGMKREIRTHLNESFFDL